AHIRTNSLSDPAGDCIRELEAQIQALKQRLEGAEAHRNTAEVHTVFAIHESTLLRHQANQRAEKKEGYGQHINMKACVMTSEEGLQMCKEDRAAHEEKEQKRKEKQRQKDANKTLLGDLASALGFEVTAKQTKAELLELINKKFDEEPDLKGNDHFVGIFKHGHKRSAPLDDDVPEGPLTPPLQRHRLNIQHPSPLPPRLQAYPPQAFALHPPPITGLSPAFASPNAGPLHLTPGHVNYQNPFRYQPPYPAYHNTSRHPDSYDYRYLPR
ncbi:hypothetical protein H0H87_012135, partial [Tephrocybe sp. NHM501043]